MNKSSDKKYRHTRTIKKSLRISEDTQIQIEGLATYFGLSQAEIMRLAIDNLDTLVISLLEGRCTPQDLAVAVDRLLRQSSDQAPAA